MDNPYLIRPIRRYPPPLVFGLRSERLPDSKHEPKEFQTIPPHLLSEIRTGNGVLFLGSGFSVPAGGPTWVKLLLKMAEECSNFFDDAALALLANAPTAPAVPSSAAADGGGESKAGHGDGLDGIGSVDPDISRDASTESVASTGSAAECGGGGESGGNGGGGVRGGSKGGSGTKGGPTSRAQIVRLVRRQRRGLVSRHGSEDTAAAYMCKVRDDVKRLMSGATGLSAFEQAAQLLDDALSAPVMVRVVAAELRDIDMDRVLADRKKYPIMAARLDIVNSMPIQTVITTNYNSLLGSTGTSAPLSKRADNRPPYADILRGEHRGAMHNPTSLLYTSCERSIVHIHGVVDEPDTIVLSREVSQRHTITCQIVNSSLQ